MKKIVLILSMAGSVAFYSCNNDPDGHNEDTEEQMPVVKDKEARETYPDPGEGTITSDDDTPLDKKTISIYTDTEGNSIQAEYSFDDTGKGQVVLKRQGKPDALLSQVGDAWASGAEYSNGKITWSAGNSSAKLTEDGKTVSYTLAADPEEV